MFLLASTLVGQPAQAQSYTFKVLHTFHGAPNDGQGPDGLATDVSGNLYGTTGSGGRGRGICASFFVDGCGTAFKLDKSGTKIWQHSFQLPTGIGPVAGLLRDKAGNLYGTTTVGGDAECQGYQYGCGALFKLDKAGEETVLHKFTNTPDRANPDSPVVEDSAGNLYGTTLYGGAFNAYGAVFKVSKNGKETVLYSFTGGSDECRPVGVTFGPDGNLYGVAEGATTCNAYGAVFKLDAAGNFTLLYGFSGSDGEYPDSALVFDANGNLYGETGNGGNSNDIECPYGCGVVFKLSPEGAETVLYRFCSLSGCADGAFPGGNLVRDKAGNLYGITSRGGIYANCNGDTCGAVFKLDSAGKETVLHSFTGGSDGEFPISGLVVDGTGALYGTAYGGGDTSCQNGCGTVFKITP
jgi:uncharacterized repeat protein (TIGR03803 family)